PHARGDRRWWRALAGARGGAGIPAAARRARRRGRAATGAGGARDGGACRLALAVGRTRGGVLAGARIPLPAARGRRGPRAQRRRWRDRARSRSRAAGEERLSMLALVGYYEPWWIQVVKSIVIFAVALQLVPVVLIAERKLLGRFQSRYGPNRVGPFGFLQPLADILKLLTKEQFRPTTSVGLLFAVAPVISIL